jgi:hypothetical protein
MRSTWSLLQLLCVIIVILGRFVNVALPFILANLIFVFEEGITSPPWLYLFGYVGLRFLQGSGGLGALLDVSRACSFFPIPLCTSEPLISRFSGPP